MATKRWESGATSVAQVQTYTFAGTWEADDVNRFQVGNRIKDFTTGSTTIATLLATLYAALNALSSDDYPEFTGDNTGFTASVVSPVLSLTANKAGVPFTCSITPLEAALTPADAQTINGIGTVTSGTTATASAGPNDWSTAANWDTGAIPVAADTVYIDNNSDSIFYGLSQAGATLTALYVYQSFEGEIGLPKLNSDDTEYPEYRTDYLTIDATTVDIGRGPGQGSGRIKINSGTVQTAVTVNNTGQAVENNLEAFLWKGTHASNAMVVRGGSVGVAVFGGETATLLTLKVENDAQVRCGQGVTLGTVTVQGGEVEINSAIGTALNVYDGLVTINGTGAVAQLNIYGGTVIYNTTGALGGNTVIEGNGRLDFSQDPSPKTVTNPIDAYNTDPVNDPDKVVTSLIIDYNGMAPIAALGTNIRITRGTPA